MQKNISWLSLAILVALLSWGCLCSSGSQELPSRQLKGAWQGSLKVPGGGSLRIVFNFVPKPGGGYTATLDSPDQGAKGIPVDSVILLDSLLRVQVGSVGGKFQGRWVADSIAGTWRQSGLEFPLVIRYVGESAEAPKRPQEPVKPYPYREEEVSYANTSAGITLAGTLTLPQGPGPFPAVVLITGSGPQDRDEALMGHRPFLVLADYLTRRGIAVLRSDDRGVGKSTGTFATATTVDFAGDVKSAVAYLETRKEIRGSEIGLIGHSEGGIIAPMVAAESKDIAFIVMMAGTGVTGEELILEQAALISQAMGASDSAVKSQRALSADLYHIVLSGKDSLTIDHELRSLLEKNAPADTTAGKATREVLINAQIRSITSPWFRFFLRYDPRPALRRVTCPVLVINGEKDLQVPPKQNLPEIEAALKEGGNRDYTVKPLPGLNHLFQTAKSGAPSEYATIEETMSPVALSAIGDWILKHCQGQKQ